MLLQDPQRHPASAQRGFAAHRTAPHVDYSDGRDASDGENPGEARAAALRIWLGCRHGPRVGRAVNDPFWPSRPWVVGHRGAPRRETENTLASFEALVGIGADAAEFDVRRSSDGVLLVYHTQWVRNAPGRRPVLVRNLTYAAICAALSSTPQARVHGRLCGGDVPPRLEDAVSQLGGRIRMDVELKQVGYEAEVLDILARHAPPETYMVTSFRESVVATCKRLHPDVRAGLLLGWHGAGTMVGMSPFRRARRCNADFIVPHKALVDTSLLDRANRDGVPVMVYTVNQQRHLERLLHDPRVAGVITDVPDVAIEIRSGR